MQVFVPATTYEEIAGILDPVRLNNQVNEAIIIAKTLLGLYPAKKSGRPGGWPDHPATKAWEGCVPSLLGYAWVLLRKRTPVDKWDVRFGTMEKIMAEKPIVYPPWWGSERIHASHRAALLWKGKVDAVWSCIPVPPRERPRWLSQNGYPVKSQMTLDALVHIERQIQYDHDPRRNWYNQFKWEEQCALPDAAGRIHYLWPTERDQ